MNSEKVKKVVKEITVPPYPKGMIIRGDLDVIGTVNINKEISKKLNK
jgi:hypothetical protein